jgi:hypothetical protein
VKPWSPRTLVEVAADNLAEGCIRETYGALMAWVQARRARDSIVHRASKSIAIDETRHATLSWQLARWADTRLRPNERRSVAGRGGEALHRLGRELTRSRADAVHRVTGLPREDEARRLFAALRPHLYSTTIE